ncbi:LytTR family DNA-binding domain-containing protein [Holzapfeliella sp. He02]|uniref:LytTR family DNA-binding domain-containing protein n=1 Tax=Holzapfeliella saturejae TaxID=3082953 RepID=A0ABU8SH54_9LACO
MSISIYICEDNPTYLTLIESIISDYLLFHEQRFKLALVTSNPDEFVQILESTQAQNSLYFLDLELNHKLTGLDLAKIIRQNDPEGKIIFISNYDSVITQSVHQHIEILGFVDKSLSQTVLRAEIFKLMELTENRIYQQLQNKQQLFSFKVGTMLYNLNFSEILFIKSAKNHQLTLQTKNSSHSFYGTLKEIVIQYPELLRISRTTLVNPANIEQIDFSKRELFFDNQISCKFSIRYTQSIKKFFLK